ncbi:alpha/beta hydrolase [uncultured Algibacter sp.]|uniref:alpha/beta fold hydrolase n=1 Tax=uncultured Algibacter sp. TaxID=298659 RepID=UPI003217A337
MKTRNKLVTINGLNIFYREAGNQNKETILLLHGFPSSSHMYRDIIESLSDTYHLIAPDYPGFGLSSAPAISEFEYTFDNVTQIMNQFIDALNLKSVHLLMQDYGGPIGFRIANERPELIKGLIIQNANAYVEGLGEWAQKIGGFVHNKDMEGLTAFKNHLMSLEGLKEQYLGGTEDPLKVDPVSYLTDLAFLDRPEARAIQTEMFNNYGSNFPQYKTWQNYFKTHQPKTLVVWGENDKFFSKAGGEAYSKDLNNIETYFFNGGHFLLEEYTTEVAEKIKQFIK